MVTLDTEQENQDVSQEGWQESRVSFKIVYSNAESMYNGMYLKQELVCSILMTHL